MQNFVGKVQHNLKLLLKPVLPLIRFFRGTPAQIAARYRANALRLGDGNSVCYLTTNFPQRPALRTEYSNGGAVKLTFLAETFPHSYPAANLLYTVSSVAHNAKPAIVLAAKKRGIKVILNQNGVAYPAWLHDGWEEVNKELKVIYAMSDYIVYQSKFCELAAQKYLGTSIVPTKIIYNPVDTNLYQPMRKLKHKLAPILLLGGNQYERYRFETAIQVLSHTLALIPGTRLIITGKLWGTNDQETMKIAQKYIRKFGVETQVDFAGRYSQKDAMQIFNQADILLHTKYNDPSPNLIPEALASGLPIIYSSSGGVPELVGAEAGIGIPVELDWEKISHPDPYQMAIAIQKVWSDLSIYSEAARQRAIEHFSLQNFIRQHKELFSQLLG